MADDNTKHGKRDTSRVAADEDYELEYFAKSNRITKEQTLELIKSTAMTGKL